VSPLRTNDARSPSRVHVIVAYEDYDAGKRAQRACRQLLEMARLDFQAASTDLWKFDMLKLKAMRAAAIEEASGADLLVLATHDGAVLPAGVWDWVQRSLMRSAPPRAMLLLFGPTPEDQESTPAADPPLRKLAVRLGVAFWSLHPEAPDGPWSEPGYAAGDLELVARAISAQPPPPSLPSSSQSARNLHG
jgi:hypothetical protein